MARTGHSWALCFCRSTEHRNLPQQSAVAQSTASISATEASDRGFSVKLPGKVVQSFGFSSKQFKFSLSSSVNPAKRDISESDEDYDLPLLKRFCKRKGEKLGTSSPAVMEEDSVEECLHGTSVVDSLFPEETSDRAILAPDPVTEAVITHDDAPATVDLQEAIVAVSSPEPVGHEPPQDDEYLEDAQVVTESFSLKRM